MRKLFLLMLCLGLVGCATTSLNENYGNFNLTQENVAKIQKGVTTKEEILSLFGQPMSKIQNSSLGEMWTYAHTKSKTTPPPFFSMQDFKVEVQSYSVTLTFDDKGIVKDFTSYEVNPVQPASMSITENK